jgi:hypothetical protein
VSLIVKVNREWIKRQIDAVRESIGRDVTFYTEDRTACTLCLPSGFYNPATNSTVFYNCPVCAGNYYLDTVTTHDILARVHWTNDEAVNSSPGGKYFIGDATATIDALDRSVAEDCFTGQGRVNVDGHTMFITKIIPMGAPEPNRYRVVLKNSGSRPE